MAFPELHPALRKLIVFGTRALLEILTARGLTLHIASGTDERAGRREAEALGIAHFFSGRIHGALLATLLAP